MTRCISRFAFLVALSGSLVVALSTHQAAAGGKSEEEVKLSVSAGKIAAGGKQTITLTAVINKGWHIYANPVGNEELGSAETLIRVTGKPKLQDVKVDYPKGKEDLKGKYLYYENKVEIPISVQRAAGDTGPLEISVRFMACNATTCKLPSTVKLSVK